LAQEELVGKLVRTRKEHECDLGDRCLDQGGKIIATGSQVVSVTKVTPSGRCFSVYYHQWCFSELDGEILDPPVKLERHQKNGPVQLSLFQKP